MKDRRALDVRRAAVLGAGVMGAQIAAHLVNCDVEAFLFELPADRGPDKSANARQAVARLAKMDPAPLSEPGRAERIVPANYDDDLPRLAGCDLVIEAVAERPDIKRDLFGKVVPHLRPDAVLATNTSGLSLAGLARALPEERRARFLGVHFFNPPRYMNLVELVPAPDTDPELLDAVETFLVRNLGKGVVRAFDTPAFIANRIGLFAILAVLHHAERLGLAPDTVDALTGPAVGRARTATFRTADLVGLDVLTHVVDGTAQALPDDPWRAHFKLPDWIGALVEQGALGRKAGAGIYRKDKDGLKVFDPAAGDYRASSKDVDPAVGALLKETNPLAALRKSDHPQAEFCWSIHRDLFHYCAATLETIAPCARDVDLALRWGYNWSRGPFEAWQAAGWSDVAEWVADDVGAGRAMADVALPPWVGEREGVHGPSGSWAPAAGSARPRSALAVYRRQLFPDRVLGEADPDGGTTIFETDAVRCWHLGGDVAIASLKTKMRTLSPEAIEGLVEAVDRAEESCAGLVLWHEGGPFSAGADLERAAGVVRAGDFEGLAGAVDDFQAMTTRLRDARVPVVAAVEGIALGGGCEVILHCARVVAALESYAGLVEAGVGLIPAGGGCRVLARRVAEAAGPGDPFPFLRATFESVAMATVAKSGEDARRLGFLRPSDVVLANARELLFVALAEAGAMAEAGYRPPLRGPFPAAGRTALANLKGALANMRAGGFISDHDHEVAARFAFVLCGGDVDGGVPVDDDHVLRLEKEAFVALARTAKTQERVAHTLKTGKPLRN